MGLFDGIENAKPTEGGVFLREGVYEEIEILGIKVGRTRKGRDFFVVEGKILKATGPQANPVGSQASWMEMLDRDNALGSVRAFVAALCGCELDEVDEKAVSALVSKDQPGVGGVIKAEASMVKTRAGGDFTKVRWTHVKPPPALAAA